MVRARALARTRRTDRGTRAAPVLVLLVLVMVCSALPVVARAQAHPAPGVVDWRTQAARDLASGGPQVALRGLDTAATTLARRLGPDHPDLGDLLLLRAQLLADAGDTEAAREVILRAMGLHTAAFGPVHPRLADGLALLALLYEREQRLWEAETVLHRAQDMTTEIEGADAPALVPLLRRRAALLRRTERADEAPALEARAAAIEARAAERANPRIPNAFRERR